MKQNRSKIKSTVNVVYIVGCLSIILGTAFGLSYLMQNVLPDSVGFISLFCLAMTLFITALCRGQIMGPFAELSGFEQTIKPPTMLSTAGKIVLTFIALMVAYWGVIYSGFSFQPVSYNALNQPVIFMPSVVQSWEITLKLGLATWVIATALAIVMGALKTTTLAGITKLLQFSKLTQKLAWIMDSIVVCCMLIVPAIILAIAIIEMVRSGLSFLNVVQPIYPQLVSLLICLAVYMSYVFFKLKQRMQNFAKKSLSIGAMLFRQTLLIFLIVMLSCLILIIIPEEMLAPLMQPAHNLFFSVSMSHMGLLVMVAIGLAMAPLLGAYLARLCTGISVRKTAIVLLLIPTIAWGIVDAIFMLGGNSLALWGSFNALSLAVPITEQNILYYAGGAQYAILSSIIILLLAFSWRTRLQESLVGMMPYHIGRRLNRVRAWLARIILLFVLITAGYIAIGLPAFYYISAYVFWLVAVGICTMVVLGGIYAYRRRFIR